MKPFRTLIPATLLCCSYASGQVNVNRAVVLGSNEPEQRQVLGLPVVHDADAALTAGAEQQGTHRLVQSVSGAVWLAMLPALATAPVAGTQFHIETPATATGPVMVQVNGFGPYPLVHAGTDTVLQEQLEHGDLLSIVFDGTAFHLLNGRQDVRRSCPEGMVAVNDQFCVEQAQRPGLPFADAAVACTVAGRRLCYWGELHATCEARTALGIMAPSTNWEWTNNTANSVNQVRRGRYTSTGSFEACYSVQAGNITSASPFRCCYTR